LKRKLHKEKRALPSIQVGLGYDRRVSHTKCISARVFMSVHEILCKGISVVVSVKCCTRKLHKWNSSRGQEGKLQPFPLSASLFLKERGEQTRSFPKQTGVNRNWDYISKFEDKGNQFSQCILFLLGPPCT